MKLILGSQSPTRKRLLARMGYEFDTISADIDEMAIRHENPELLTLALARAKSEALLPKLKEPVILITSDTVADCNGMILEKAVDEEEVRRWFAMYEHHPVRGVTAMVAVNTATGKRAEGVVVASVQFRRVPEVVISGLVEEGAIFGYSGAFTMDHPALQEYIAWVDGEPEILQGMPVALTRDILRQVGGV